MWKEKLSEYTQGKELLSLCYIYIYIYNTSCCWCFNRVILTLEALFTTLTCLLLFLSHTEVHVKTFGADY